MRMLVSGEGAVDVRFGVLVVGHRSRFGRRGAVPRCRDGVHAIRIGGPGWPEQRAELGDGGCRHDNPTVALGRYVGKLGKPYSQLCADKQGDAEAERRCSQQR